MAGVISVPRDLLAAFAQFQRDFDQVTAGWIATGAETGESVEAMRGGLRAYLGDLAEPDEYGFSRAERLWQVFEFWRGLAGEVRHVAVRPVLSDATETRLADSCWKRAVECAQAREERAATKKGAR